MYKLLVGTLLALVVSLAAAPSCLAAVPGSRASDQEAAIERTTKQLIHSFIYREPGFCDRATGGRFIDGKKSYLASCVSEPAALGGPYETVIAVVNATLDGTLSTRDKRLKEDLASACRGSAVYMDVQVNGLDLFFVGRGGAKQARDALAQASRDTFATEAPATAGILKKQYC